MSMSTSELALTNTIISNPVTKSGTIIPNRIFVGGIASVTTDQQLKDFFSEYGAVKDTKIICDRAGLSKGYGFVTFETQEDAEKIIEREGENLIFKERKLNIGPAVRKQQVFSRVEGIPAVSGAAAAMLFAPTYGYPSQSPSLAVVPSDYQTYHPQMQQQVPNYPILQGPLYMQQPAYQAYSPTVPAQQTASNVQANGANVQYAANPQWAAGVPARIYTSSQVTSPPASFLPDNAMYAESNGAQNQTMQQPFLGAPEGTMHESCTNDVESTYSATPSSCAQLTPNNCPQLASLMSVPVSHSLHLYQNSTSPQPPPVKKIASMAPQYANGDPSVRCFAAPPVGSNVNATMMNASSCTGNRIANVSFLSRDGRLATNIASIAPPTPPATPAATVENR